MKSKCGVECDNKDVESETLSENGRKRLKDIFEESYTVQNNNNDNRDVTRYNKSIEQALSGDSGICTLRDTRSEVFIESPTKRRRLDRTRCVGNDCSCNHGPTSAVVSEISDVSCKIENGRSEIGSNSTSLEYEVKYHKSLSKYSSEFIAGHEHLEPRGLGSTDKKLEVDGDREVEQVEKTDNISTNGSQLKISEVGFEKADSLQTNSLFWTTSVKEPGINSKKALSEHSQLFYKPLDFYRSYKSLVAGLRN